MRRVDERTHAGSDNITLPVACRESTAAIYFSRGGGGFSELPRYIAGR